MEDWTRIQARVDRDVDAKAQAVLDELGLNAADVIRALWARIADEGRLPFDLAVTDRNEATRGLMQAVYAQKTPILSTKEAVAAYLLEDSDEDDY